MASTKPAIPTHARTAPCDRGRRGADDEQQRDQPDPRQPPPGRGGKGQGGQRAGDQRRRVAPDGRQVADALAISAIAASSVALNSSSLCCAVSPSVSAREKLAMTPLLRASRSQASSRL